MNKLGRLVILLGFFLGLLSPAFAVSVSASSGPWQQGPSLTTARSYATATLLSDGRVAFVGGKDANGNPLASMEWMMPDGTITAGPSMSAPRYGHSAILLGDGRLLVAGGRSTYGAVLNSAEIFNPATGVWSAVSSAMRDPRADFTMSLLSSGDVLVAGGNNGSGPVNSIDLFSPSSGSFTYQTNLSVARMAHTASVLKDGRVLFTGGTGVGTGGSLTTLSWTEIYDPSTNSISSGPALKVARTAHTATTLIDGTILIVGGSNGNADLASLEVYDPVANTVTLSSATLTTARSGHVALLLPNNNHVLIAGGTSAGSALASTELYRSWTSSVVANAPMSLTRQGAAATALQADGSAIVAGGSTAHGTDVFSFATVKTDASDYAPGTTVNITGSGWVPGETVTLDLLESPFFDQPPQMSAVADAQGNISNYQFAPDTYDLNTRFYLTAKGSASEAQTTFTDSQTDNVTLAISGPSATVSNNLNSNKCVWNGTNQTGTGCTVAVNNGTQVTFTATLGANWSTTTQQYTLNCNAGSSICTVTTAGNKDATLQVVTLNKTTPSLSVTNSPVTYSGSTQAATVQSSVSGTVSNVKYGGSAIAPTQAGTYAVTADFLPTDTAAYNSLTGAAAGNFVIQRATPTFSVTNSPVAYNGSAQAATPAATGVSGTALTGSFSNVKYNGSATLPTQAGTYAITADFTPQDATDYTSVAGAAIGNFVIQRATPTLSVTNSPMTYNGSTQAALVSGSVAGTISNVSYNGSATVPTQAGTYAVTADFTPQDGTDYSPLTGASAGNFVIQKATPTLSVSNSPVTYNGSAESATIAASGVGGAALTGSFVNVKYGGSPIVPTNAGQYVVTADFTPQDTTNYTSLTAVSAGNFTISKAVASVTPAVASKTYGTADPTLTGTLTGFVAADNVAATYSRIAGETVAGGPYTISATLSPAGVLGNYDITYKTANFTISKAVVSVTPAAASKTYGTADPTLTGTLTGFVAADNVTATYTRTAGETVAGGPYTISATLAPAGVLGNYDITYNTAKFTINKATASVTPNALSKTYGMADPTLTGTLTGFQAADDVTATYTRTAGETVAGGPYTISATLAPAGVLGNYDVTYNTATFTINKATASVIPAAASKTYGTADPTLTGTLSGFLAADNVTATYTRTAGETVAGGPYTISATLAPVGVLANYDITYKTANFTINKATASVTPNALSKTYGMADPTLTGTLTGLLTADNVTATYSRAAGETVAGGPYTISATLAPAGVLGNYDVTYNTAAFTINRAAASVTPAVASKTYGTADPTLTGTLSGFLAADNVTATYGRTAGDTVAGGPYTISATLSPAGVLGNYDITYKTANFTINKAKASVTPAAASKTYGTDDPTLSGTLAGFVAGDNVTAAYTRASGNTVGSYAITATLSPAAVLGNYDITYNTADFVINKAKASVTPAAASKTYGTDDPTLTGTLAGFLQCDGVTAAYTRAAGNTVGSYAITATLSPAAVLGNYDITYNTADFVINKAKASVTPNTASKTYGTADPPLGGSLSGFLAADGVSAVYSRTSGETAGSYNITATLSPAGVLSNYDITYNTGDFTINKAKASVTPNTASKTYGTTDPGLTGTLSGFLAADGVTATYSRTVGETAGSYNITATLSPAAVLGNYDITYNTGDFTINKAKASVTPNAASKTYGAADPAFTGTLTGFVGSDNVAATYSRTVGETAGSYNITATLSPAAVLGNYDITYNAADFVIDKAKASVTPAAASKTYGTDDPTLTGTLAGFLQGDGVTATYTRAAGNTAGSYAIAATLSPAAVLGNYDITYSTADFVINKRTLTASAKAQAKTYDGGNSATATLSDDRVTGDQVTVSFTGATFSDRNVGTNKTVTVSGISISGPDAANYSLASATATATADITARPIEVTAATDTKTYDGTKNSTGSPVLSGGSLAAGDTASYSQVFDSRNAGTRSLIPTVVITDGNDGKNYSVTAHNAAGSISPLSITGSITAADKTYDGTTAATITSRTLTGAVTGDSVVYSGDSATFVDSNAGLAKLVTATGLVLTGGDAGNYTVNSSANTTANIAKADQTITWNTPSPMIYGSSLSSTQLNATVVGVSGGTAPGALTYTPAAGTVLTAGTNTLSVSAAATNNYNPATKAVQIAVNYSVGTCLGDLGHSILQPINAGGTSTFKQGSTVPAKFRVCDANGNSIGSAGVVSAFNLVGILNGTQTTPVDDVVASTTPDANFRWDPSGQQWIFNISTKPLPVGKTYIYAISLNDGTTITFQYGLPK